MIKIRAPLFANIIIALAIGAALYFTRSEKEAIVASLTALIAFTPFNLVLGSTLVSKRAARLLDSAGIKMHSTEALLKLSMLDTVAFSMNKMLTTGEYFITDIFPVGMTQAGLLSMAASAERNATHPLGKKIFETAEARGLKLDNATMSNELEGNGVEALINGLTVRVGRPGWVKSEGVRLSPELRIKIDQIASKFRTPLVVCLGRIARGLLGLKDEVDERAKIFLDRLRFNGLETVLLTAESKKKATALIKGLSIDVVRTELSPVEKAREIQLMQARGKIVAEIGSEEHDRPAFDAADVSIFISNDGSGSTDFVISDWEQFFELRTLAAKTNKILRQNKRIAFATWLLLAPLVVKTTIDAASIPYPPLIATIGVSIGAGLIIWNSRRLNF